MRIKSLSLHHALTGKMLHMVFVVSRSVHPLAFAYISRVAHDAVLNCVPREQMANFLNQLLFKVNLPSLLNPARP